MTRPTEWGRPFPMYSGIVGGESGQGEGQPPSVDCCDPDPSTDRGADGIAWALGTVASELNEPHGTVADGGGDKTFTNPTNTNDGDDATFATRNSFAGGAGTYVSILRTDLGAAYEVTGMTIVGGAGASGSDFDAVPWYVDWSDDGTTWTNTSMTQVDHADTPVLSSATSVITLDTAATHRYWRIRHETTITGIEFRVALFVRTWDIAGLVTGGWTIRADPVIDGADATYETVTGTDLLRVDLGSALRIVRTRIRIAANTAGARTFTIKGANLVDFSDEVTLTTIAFTATGSYTAQDVEATWANTVDYRYYELSIGTSDTYRIHSWELYEGNLATDLANHTGATDDAHDASAIDYDNSGSGLTADNVQDAIDELAAGGGDFVTTTDGGGEVINEVSAAGSTETLDLADGNVHDVTLTADCTFTFAAVDATRARSFTLVLRQDGTGGWDVTWPGSVVWGDGSAPTLDTTASTVSVLTFFTLDGGTTWFGFATGGGSTIAVLDDVGDVNAPAPSDGQVLTWDSTPGEWVAATPSVVAALDDLTDVAITTPAEDEQLQYISGSWVNNARRWEPVTFDPGSGPEIVFDSTDVVMTWKEY